MKAPLKGHVPSFKLSIIAMILVLVGAIAAGSLVASS
jgi:hypothetical protein